MQASKVKPLSPHLGIYRPQISSVLSILHRATGVSNFFGMVLFVWWVVFLTFTADNVAANFVYSFCSTVYGKVILMAWTFGLFLHACTGIRHLFWDAGYGFDLPVMHKTGWASVIGAVILTAITWSIYFNIIGK